MKRKSGCSISWNCFLHTVQPSLKLFLQLTVLECSQTTLWSVPTPSSNVHPLRCNSSCTAAPISPSPMATTASITPSATAFSRRLTRSIFPEWTRADLLMALHNGTGHGRHATICSRTPPAWARGYPLCPFEQGLVTEHNTTNRGQFRRFRLDRDRVLEPGATGIRPFSNACTSSCALATALAGSQL